MFSNIHDLKTDLNYLPTKTLSFYCVLDKINFALCLTYASSNFLDYKIILKLYFKTTFNSVFVEKNK